MIATSDGQLKDSDLKIIDEYVKKQFRAGIIPSRFDSPATPNGVIKSAIADLRAMNNSGLSRLLNSLRSLEPSTKDDVANLWLKIAKNSDQRFNIYQALCMKVFYQPY